MSQETFRRVARDGEGRSYLWVVSHDPEGYHVCVWHLTAGDLEAITAWDRMMSLRRSIDLPELPAPDNLSNPEPDKLTVENLEDARSFLVGTQGPALAWHAQEFFHQIDPMHFDCGTGTYRV